MNRVLVLTCCAVPLVACSGTKNFTVDAGPSAPVDAGPCDPTAQTGCASGQKCTLGAVLEPTCGASGAKGAYSPCANDADCAPGTTCIVPPSTMAAYGLQTSQACYPFCNPQVSRSLPCPQGGICALGLADHPAIGLCDQAAPDAGTGDGGTATDGGSSDGGADGG